MKQRTNSRSGVPSSNLLIPIVVLMTMTCAGQAGAQAARSMTPRASIAGDVSAQLIEDPSSDSGHLTDRQTVRERPIEDFIDAQGTANKFLFYAGPDAPGLRNYAVGVTTANCPGDADNHFCQYPTSRIAVVDYAGGANKYLERHGYGSLGTKTEGSITERLLPDGRAEVTVILYTTNALTFASTFDPSPPPNSPPQSAETNTRLFGSSVQDLFRDSSRRPSLGNSSLIMIFKNTRPRAPMPDLVNLFAFGVQPPNFEWISFYLNVNVTGSLPDGQKAKCKVLQHFVNPPPLLIDGVLTPDPKPLLLDDGWISEFVDIN
jgi:hypothetical protein